MALGIETNNIAPQLIQNSGAALVQGIRQIGQQISGHLTEIQTKRDLGALAQEAQGLNPESTDFPLQLMQLGSRHPMALRDERGQMLLSIPAKAHAQWQAGEAEARAFNRAMAMQRQRTRDARDLQTSKPINVPRGSRLTDPLTGEVIVDAEPLPEKGFNLAPGATRYNADGTPIVTAPARTGAGGLTPYQQEMQKRAATQRNIGFVKTKLSQTREDIKRMEKRYLDLNEEEKKLNPKKADHAPKLQQIFDSRKEVGSRLEALGREREQLEQEFERAAVGEEAPLIADEELGAVPPDAAAPSAVLPDLGAVAPAASNSEFVLVVDPQGKPGRIRASQLESALANGYKRR
jgi:hypothetical protein